MTENKNSVKKKMMVTMNVPEPGDIIMLLEHARPG